MRPGRKSASKSRRKPPESDAQTLALLSSIVDGSDDAIIGKTLAGVVTSWNEGARRIYGYRREEMLGRSISTLVPPDRPDEIPKILKKVQKGLSISHFETVRRKKNGELIDVSLTISPIRDRAGKVVGASTIARDITERKHAEARFRLAVEAAPNAMIMTDADGRIVLVNTQTEKLFGYARAELMDKTIEILLPQRHRETHIGLRAGYFAAPSIRSMGAGRDLFGARKDGSEVPVEIGLNPIKTAEGEFVLASVIDITERKILQKKLAHAEVLASIGAMAAAMGHEIRNPLSSIVMAAQALSRGGLGAEDQTHITSILVKEGQRLQRILEDFLQYSRPRTPKLASGDLNATAREVLEAARSDERLVGKTALEQKLDKNLPALPFDADQIRQVLWNVLRNALQAADGRGKVELRTEARPGEAVIHVSDTGPGIPADEIKNIFMPFFTTKTTGTGLGLPISRNIVLAHGGEILIDGAPGGGCRFSIVLPLRASR